MPLQVGVTASAIIPLTGWVYFSYTASSYFSINATGKINCHATTNIVANYIPLIYQLGSLPNYTTNYYLRSVSPLAIDFIDPCIYASGTWYFIQLKIQLKINLGTLGMDHELHLYQPQ